MAEIAKREARGRDALEDLVALAVDEAGVVQAVNRPAREYLGLTEDPRGRELKEVIRLARDEVDGWYPTRAGSVRVCARP